MAFNNLNHIWTHHGARHLIREFRITARRNKSRALGQINGTEVVFPVLYTLLPELERPGLLTGLSARNARAVQVYRYFADKRGVADDSVFAQPDYDCAYWIFSTGSDWPGPAGDSRYGAIIDYAAALLIIEFGRADILPEVAALMFERHRNGQYIGDLAWSFFQIYDPGALKTAAQYLLSDDERDVALACKLLHIESRPGDSGEKTHLYDEYITSLKENSPFLYLTGEYFNATSEPEAVRCNLGAKYLHREISPHNGMPKEPLTEDERRILAAFESLPETARLMLSEHSYRLHKEDVHAWHEWMADEPYTQAAAIGAETGRA